MKQTTLILATTLLALAGSVNSAHAQGTAFTYQGRLADGDGPANGLYTFRFRLVQTNNGQPQGPVLTNNSVAVSNGLFTTTLDFGDYFGEREFGLEIGVRANGSPAPFAILAPNQVIRPAPLAIAANHATLAGGLTGTLPDFQLSPNVALLNASQAFTANNSFGNLTLTPPATLSFGSQTRQMLNLWGARYAVGVQPGTLYFRADDGSVNDGFAWFKGGSHVENISDPGSGGAKLMALTSVGLGVGVPATLSSGVVANGAAIRSGGDFFNPQLLVQQTNTNDWARLRMQSGGPAWDIALGPGSQPALNFWNSSANVLTLAQNGDASLQGNLEFGTGALRQMLDLWAGAHGIGVQAWTTYFRTIGGGANGGFAWYKGGVHADSQYDPGGGEELMRLNGSGLSLPGDLFFSQSYPRQFVNFGTSVAGSVAGIGQKGYAGEIFFRSGGDFVWYRDGTLNNIAGNAGTGGLRLMWLSSNGLEVGGWVEATTFMTSSDRSAKEQFKPVNPAEVLAKVAALPVTEWQFKADPSMRHIGPMAQDFYAAFNVGPDDKHIATVDADGVALAAIQGLNQKVEQELMKKDAQLKSQQQQIAELLGRLQALEQKLDSKEAHQPD